VRLTTLDNIDITGLDEYSYVEKYGPGGDSCYFGCIKITGWLIDWSKWITHFTLSFPVTAVQKYWNRSRFDSYRVDCCVVALSVCGAYTVEWLWQSIVHCPVIIVYRWRHLFHTYRCIASCIAELSIRFLCVWAVRCIADGKALVTCWPCSFQPSFISPVHVSFTARLIVLCGTLI